MASLRCGTFFGRGGGRVFLHAGRDLDVQVLHGELARDQAGEEQVAGFGEGLSCLKRIGEDVSEKLDYTPGQFTVERHVRGKWAYAKCETLIQAPVPAHVIDKGTQGHLWDYLQLKRQRSDF